MPTSRILNANGFVLVELLIAMTILAGSVTILHTIFANLVAKQGTGFESDDNEVVLVLRTGENIPVSRAPKAVIAHRIFDTIVKLRLALHTS